MGGFSIDFELGDTVYCPYYKVTGVVIELRHRREFSLPYITIREKTGNEVVAQARVISGPNNIPFYLQMIKKKGD